LSAAPDKYFVVFQFTLIHHTAFVCPLYMPNCSPFNEHQKFGVTSLADENSTSPSLLYLIWVMVRSCSRNIKGFCWEKLKTHKNNTETHHRRAWSKTIPRTYHDELAEISCAVTIWQKNVWRIYSLTSSQTLFRRRI